MARIFHTVVAIHHTIIEEVVKNDKNITFLLKYMMQQYIVRAILTKMSF